MIFQLADDIVSFPSPLNIPREDREDDGLYAVGGDLQTERLLEAYAMGIFPWADCRQKWLTWYCPIERFVIFPDEVHVSHSMRTLINKGRYSVSFDRDFEGVIGQCSALRINERGAWLGPEMVAAYTELHRQGYAHSVEVWEGDRLVGGLYGVLMGRCFMGESMFSLVPSASKLALVYLCQLMSTVGVNIVDCQFETPHLRSMGGRYISYEEYLALVWGQEALDVFRTQIVVTEPNDEAPAQET